MTEFDKFCLTLNNLKDIYDYKEPYKYVILIGSANLFRICFEQACKAIEEVLELNGFEKRATHSYKQILKTAYKAGLITDEETWLSALASQNNFSNVDNEAIALDIVNLTKEKYFDMFKALKTEIETKNLM